MEQIARYQGYAEFTRSIMEVLDGTIRMDDEDERLPLGERIDELITWVDRLPIKARIHLISFVNWGSCQLRSYSWSVYEYREFYEEYYVKIHERHQPQTMALFWGLLAAGVDTVSHEDYLELLQRLDSTHACPGGHIIIPWMVVPSLDQWIAILKQFDQRLTAHPGIMVVKEIRKICAGMWAQLTAKRYKNEIITRWPELAQLYTPPSCAANTFSVIRLPRGLKVSHPVYPAVQAEGDGIGWVVTRCSGANGRIVVAGNAGPDLLNALATMMIGKRRPPPRRAVAVAGLSAMMTRVIAPLGMRALRVTDRDITYLRCGFGMAVMRLWREIRHDMIQSRVIECSSRCFSVSPWPHNTPKVLLDQRFWANHYLVKDLCQYHAARLAFAHLRMDQFSKDGWCPPHLIEDVIEGRRSWMTVFSPDHTEPHGALRRTLMGMERSVRAWDVRYLHRIDLPEPVTATHHLRLLSSFWEVRGLRLPELTPGEVVHVVRTIKRVTPEDIVAAAAILRAEVEAMGAQLSNMRHFQRPDIYIRRVFATIWDLPGPIRPSLVDQVRESIRWHAEVRDRWARENAERENAERMIGNGSPPQSEPGADVVLAAPPWEDPAQVGVEIRRCLTVGDLREEGAEMHHCVGFYAQDCIHGQFFIYHLTKDGSRATVQVDRMGRVLQSRGPCNGITPAARWAERHLADLIRAKWPGMTA